MACLYSLKQDIKSIESAFPKTHDRFQTTSTTPDDLTFKFIDDNNKKHEIHATITDDYPTSRPVWFADTEKTQVLDAVEMLNDTTGLDTNIISQVTILIKELCRRHSLPEPTEIIKLMSPAPSTSDMDSNVAPSAEDDHIDDGEDDENDTFVSHDDDNLFEEMETEAKKQKIVEPFDYATLSKIEKMSNLIGSPEANNRLMRDLKEVHGSDDFKNKVYTVELVDDNLYEWNVAIRVVDSDSLLFQDLQRLKNEDGLDSILFRMSFNKKYPHEPPFIRVLKPIIQGGFITNGGALCMELLTNQGWSSAYSIESLIVQISATLVKGKARIRKFAKPELASENPETLYTRANAERSFRNVIKVHTARGWITPPVEEG